MSRSTIFRRIGSRQALEDARLPGQGDAFAGGGRAPDVAGAHARIRPNPVRGWARPHSGAESVHGNFLLWSGGQAGLRTGEKIMVDVVRLRRVTP